MSANRISSYIQNLFSQLFSEKARHSSERIILFIAIGSFALHLLLMALVKLEIISINDPDRLLENPIAAIYTPFSFILIYEIYLLIFHLPNSTTVYIGKQYEIITLIVIRRLFKDLSKLELTPDWFQTKDDLQFTYDIIATILLFLLIFLFNRLNIRRGAKPKPQTNHSKDLKRFIQLKNGIALVLVPLFLFLAIYSLGDWIYNNFFSIKEIVGSIRDVNDIFYDEFFTVLILVDVLILLFSFVLTDQFHKVMRNSGFVISTILIKLSFSAEGLLNTVLIVVAVLFGVIVLAIHNLFEKKLSK